MTDTESECQNEFQAADLTNAFRRIQSLYHPDLFRQMGDLLLSHLQRHFQAVESAEASSLNWTLPEDNIALAHRSLQEGEVNSRYADSSPEEIATRFSELITMALDHSQNLHHPHYIGHQVPAPVPLAAIFDALGSVTNQVMAIYEMGPWASSVERALIEKVGMQVGLPSGGFSGLVTHGGSLANLTGLLTARNVLMENCWQQGVASIEKRPVILVHEDAHYGISRAVGVLGLGTNQIVRVGLDSHRRMDPQKLKEHLFQLKKNQTPIVAVVACACATPMGAFDPLESIADLCEEFQVWLHVDAAHGGAACFSQRHAHVLKGLARADSFILDAHKMMFVPALCAFVFYKNKEHRFETFQQDAPYLFDPTSPGMADFDSGLLTFECTKRAATFGLWGLWSLFGPQLFEDLVDLAFHRASQFCSLLEQAEDFTSLHKPECNIVVFRHIPMELKVTSLETIGQFQRMVRRSVIESGDGYLVQTTAPDGIGALRVCFMNPLTELSHCEAMLKIIRSHGKKVLNSDSFKNTS